jgi:hypothetical protein
LRHTVISFLFTNTEINTEIDTEIGTEIGWILLYAASSEIALKGRHEIALKGRHEIALKGRHEIALKGRHEIALKGRHEIALKGRDKIAMTGAHAENRRCGVNAERRSMLRLSAFPLPPFVRGGVLRRQFWLR